MNKKDYLIVAVIIAWAILFVIELNTNLTVTKIDLELHGKKPLNIDSFLRYSHHIVKPGK